MSDIGMLSAGHRQVGFGEAIRLFFKNYVNFQGRSSRGAYWWFILFELIASLILGFIDGIIGIQVLSSLFFLAIIIGLISLGFRRLHDIGRSAWWLLIGLIPIIGTLVLIWWAIQPGQRSSNQFGPDVEAGR